MSLLFNNIDQVRKWVQNIDASTNFNDIDISLRSAERYISGLLSIDINTLDISLIDTLSEAIANLAMYNYSVSLSIRKRSQGIDIYKYELETLRREYLNNYQLALDHFVSLAAIVDDKFNINKPEDLIVHDVMDFNHYYPIGNSAFFFWLCIPLQREIIDRYLVDIDISKLDSVYIHKLKRFIVFYVLSIAIERFDMAQLPTIIHSNSPDGISRNAEKDNDHLYKLSKNLRDDADVILSEIISISIINNGNDITVNDYNSVTKKFYSVC